MTNIITNLILLSFSLSTNTHPGEGLFRRMGDNIVGIRSIEYAVRQASVGFMDGTNAVQLFETQKMLWAKTNWYDMPIVVGVGAPNGIGAGVDTQAVKLQSTPATVKPKAVKPTQPKSD